MVTTERLTGLVTRSQAARMLGVSGETVSKAWRTGRLGYVETPLGKLVRVEDLEAYRARREARWRAAQSGKRSVE